ncbi:hypothetical protein PGIGA_G00193960 [Pangasianodon gigas]|uniref:Uncharacterized protein n=1 Tax=Pangasianodon gigas TaxID=30993 RepID=A0ACC5WDI4_PANGG|nr:hypothetical protein [Pangasianodon gigas]
MPCYMSRRAMLAGALCSWWGLPCQTGQRGEVRRRVIHQPQPRSVTPLPCGSASGETNAKASKSGDSRRIRLLPLHQALREDPPAPMLTHSLLQMTCLRSVESNVSRAEHPAGLHQIKRRRRRSTSLSFCPTDAETEHRSPEEHQKITRSTSLNIIPPLMSHGTQ